MVLTLRLITHASDHAGKEDLKKYIKAVMKEPYEYVK